MNYHPSFSALPALCPPAEFATPRRSFALFPRSCALSLSATRLESATSALLHRNTRGGYPHLQDIATANTLPIRKMFCYANIFAQSQPHHALTASSLFTPGGGVTLLYPEGFARRVYPDGFSPEGLFS